MFQIMCLLQGSHHSGRRESDSFSASLTIWILGSSRKCLELSGHPPSVLSFYYFKVLPQPASSMYGIPTLLLMTLKYVSNPALLSVSNCLENIPPCVFSRHLNAGISHFSLSFSPSLFTGQCLPPWVAPPLMQWPKPDHWSTALAPFLATDSTFNESPWKFHHNPSIYPKSISLFHSDSHLLCMGYHITQFQAT